MGMQGLGVFTLGSMVSAFGMVAAIQLENLATSPLLLRLAGMTIALVGIVLSSMLARRLRRESTIAQQGSSLPRPVLGQ